MAANQQRIPLAKMAVEETRMGVVEDKVIKVQGGRQGVGWGQARGLGRQRGLGREAAGAGSPAGACAARWGLALILSFVPSPSQCPSAAPRTTLPLSTSTTGGGCAGGGRADASATPGPHGL
jgi:hypothetical protein